MRALLNLSALLLVATTVFAQTSRGALVERVVSAADPDQTYALYLPSTYDPAKRYPALLIFDPGARGPEAVKLFQAAAERLGWIVMASNNSRNFAPEQHLAAVSALWPELHQRYATDPKRVYLAGFSGGARRSMAIAAAPECKGCIAGIVACGAGISGTQRYPSTKTATYLVAGLYDYNYGELFESQKVLAEGGAPNRFVVFDGGHEWLPASEAESAMEWFTVRAMAEKRVPADEAYVAKRYEQEIAAAHNAESTDAFKAFELYRAIVNDFGLLRDVSAAKQAIARLEKSPELKKAQKRAHDQLRKTEELLRDPRQAFFSIQAADAAQRRMLIGEVRSTGERWRKKREGNPPADELVPLRRAMGSLLTTGYEEGEAQIKAKNNELAAAYLEAVAPLARDEYMRKYLDSRAAALRGDRKAALKLLKEALAAGLPERKKLGEDDAFQTLRGNPEFAAMIGAP